MWTGPTGGADPGERTMDDHDSLPSRPPECRSRRTPTGGVGKAASGDANGGRAVARSALGAAGAEPPLSLGLLAFLVGPDASDREDAGAVRTAHIFRHLVARGAPEGLRAECRSAVLAFEDLPKRDVLVVLVVSVVAHRFDFSAPPSITCNSGGFVDAASSFRRSRLPFQATCGLTK